MCMASYVRFCSLQTRLPVLGLRHATPMKLFSQYIGKITYYFVSVIIIIIIVIVIIIIIISIIIFIIIIIIMVITNIIINITILMIGMQFL